MRTVEELKTVMNHEHNTRIGRSRASYVQRVPVQMYKNDEGKHKGTNDILKKRLHQQLPVL